MTADRSMPDAPSNSTPTTAAAPRTVGRRGRRVRWSAASGEQSVSVVIDDAVLDTVGNGQATVTIYARSMSPMGQDRRPDPGDRVLVDGIAGAYEVTSWAHASEHDQERIVAQLRHVPLETGAAS